MKRHNLFIQNKKGGKGRVTKCILFAVAATLALSSILMTVETATSSVEVSNLRDREKKLLNERRNLENVLAQSLSMNDLEQKGSEMGYAEPSNLVYLSGDSEVVAKLP